MTEATQVAEAVEAEAHAETNDRRDQRWVKIPGRKAGVIGKRSVTIGQEKQQPRSSLSVRSEDEVPAMLLRLCSQGRLIDQTGRSCALCPRISIRNRKGRALPASIPLQ
jgi:hypothetical protein